MKGGLFAISRSHPGKRKTGRGIHLVTNARLIDRFEHWQTTWRSDLRSKKIQLYLPNDGAGADENRLGAVRDLQFVLQRLPHPSGALVSAGDNIFRFRLLPLWQQFLNSNESHVVALPETDEAKLKKTGVLTLGNHNRVMRLHEKPESFASTWCCPPLYFLQSSAWSRLNDYLQVSNQCDAPGSFEDFLCQREAVYACLLDAPRLDIGSIPAYHQATSSLEKNLSYRRWLPRRQPEKT
jgi:glucose-1-phosphate thymidylyltransferase